ncbi:Zinc finger CCCH domain-containing protein 67 [Acorus gramineus]|uniref:Zinc finger CCCH domain-containing protein 67 n=1 Tax=Acorus gramineus TaxID=55184 RepID=A0AAV9B6J5_ACOGR|nr:Zinc finger CCCH domain-containing protein 67 [Acorus gramineus]
MGNSNYAMRKQAVPGTPTTASTSTTTTNSTVKESGPSDLVSPKDFEAIAYVSALGRQAVPGTPTTDATTSTVKESGLSDSVSPKNFEEIVYLGQFGALGRQPVQETLTTTSTAKECRSIGIVRNDGLRECLGDRYVGALGGQTVPDTLTTTASIVKEAEPSDSASPKEGAGFENLVLEEAAKDEEGGSSSSGASAKDEIQGDGEGHQQRPGQRVCVFYVKTGRCTRGSNCMFYHNPMVKGQIHRDEEEVLDKPGAKACKYFLMSGACKYGSTCKFSHSQEPELNLFGLPIRPGEKECSFYMRTGSCKFAANCRFHHPDPTAVTGSDSMGSHSNDSSQSYTQEASPSPIPSWSPSHMPGLNISPGVIHPDSEWNSFQAPVVPSYPPEWVMQEPPFSAANDFTKSAENISHQQNPQINEFPERPGQPECPYYKKTGNCKYKSCKYHHPKMRPSKSSRHAASPLGLPLRPGQPICAHFSRFGVCKFGPSCKFDHPLKNAPGHLWYDP